MFTYQRVVAAVITCDEKFNHPKAETISKLTVHLQFLQNIFPVQK